MARLTLTSARHGVLTERQRDYLTGQLLFFLDDGEEVFSDEAEAANAWRRHRNELMLADCGGRLRPWGYFKYELNSTPVWWEDELACLLDRDLISRDEVFGLEQRFPTLREDAGQKFSSVENPAWLNSQRFGDAVLRGMARECAVAARWHTWRGRDELSNRFSARAEAIRQAAGEKTA